MDLTSNNEKIFTGQPCLNRVIPGVQKYLNYKGAFVFEDTKGSSDPSFDLLTTRFVFLFSSDDFVSKFQMSPDALPAQSFQVVLADQNMIVRLFTLDIDTQLPSGYSLPTGADVPYQLQSFLAPNPQYAVTGYWVSSYAV